jgi:hypothetical protein
VSPVVVIVGSVLGIVAVFDARVTKRLSWWVQWAFWLCMWVPLLAIDLRAL